MRSTKSRSISRPCVCAFLRRRTASLLVLLVHLHACMSKRQELGGIWLSPMRSVRGGSTTAPSSSASTPSSRAAFTAMNKPKPTVVRQFTQQSSTSGARSSSRSFNRAEESIDQQQIAKEMLDAFLTRDSRNSFIARVYSILSVQLVVTAASVLAFGLNPEMGRWMRRPTGGIGTSVPFLSLLLSTICWFTMCSSVTARRRSPLKWHLLILFTVGEALSVGFISSFYKFRSVVAALLATATAATSVSVYTITQKNPKYDLSQWGAGLSSCGLIFVVYGVIQLLSMLGVLPPGLLPYNEMLYGLVGACLFSFYLAHHTKLIVAGKHAKYQMNEKDYVFGAMTLYNDIINLFIYTLRMIGEDRDDK